MKKSKLKKRLRKKHHLGEFQEMGFEIFANLKTDLSETEFDNFVNDFIKVIEKNKMKFAGGGKETWEGFAVSAKNFNSPTKMQKESVENWLENRQEVLDYKVGNFIDAWHDPMWND